MAKKILINISNIHAGGALQVAVSFISELISGVVVDKNIKIVVSSEVAKALNQEQWQSSEWDISILNIYGIRALLSDLNSIQKEYDVVFTLFGPKYTLLKAKIDIVGFAQPWILQFDNSITRSMPFFNRAKLKFKFALQEWFFKRADHLVVELEHVKDSLARQSIFPNDKVSIVHNSVSNLYLEPSKWQNVQVNRAVDDIAIGFVTRDYPHKNIHILPNVARILRERYHLPVKFYLSLTPVEWKSYSEAFGDFGETVGSLSVYQCPSFYQQMDAVIFPSLLECFSATPLEALAMKKPLFASDRGFVHDICQSYALYFDPLDSESIAEVIAGYFKGQQKTDAELEKARQHVFNFSNANQRAKDYLSVIYNLIENKNV